MKLIIDEQTETLINLTRESITNRKLDQIIALLNVKCPKLLEGLCKRRTNNVVSKLKLRCYPRDEVVFAQDAEADAFYTVIRGAVSIYARNSTAVNTTHEENIDHNELSPNSKKKEIEPPINMDRSEKFGRFLVQLPPGSSFGELSFNADGNHSKRSAGVVSDGSHGQRKVYTSDNREIEASDVAVLLLIPSDVYLKEMFGRDISKHQTKEKVDFLKSSFIFKEWSVDQLVFLSYEMKKYEISAGTSIVCEGCRAENVFIIKCGKVQISVKVQRNGRHKQKNIGTKIEIATLGANDLFGIVEALNKYPKMKRTAEASTDVVIFSLSSKALVSFLPQVPRTQYMLGKLARARMSWEEIRADFAFKFPSMTLCLNSRFQREMSAYQLSPKMAMTTKELKRRSERSLILYKALRDARSAFRQFKNKGGIEMRGSRIAKSLLYKSKGFCTKAIIVAREIEDDERHHQAEELQENVIRLLSRYDDGRFDERKRSNVSLIAGISKEDTCKSCPTHTELSHVNTQFPNGEKESGDMPEQRIAKNCTDDQNEEVSFENRFPFVEDLFKKAGLSTSLTLSRGPSEVVKCEKNVKSLLCS